VALSASLIWECRQAGSANNGGGFLAYNLQ
jgi:hypothetical protein